MYTILSYKETLKKEVHCTFSLLNPSFKKRSLLYLLSFISVYFLCSLKSLVASISTDWKCTQPTEKNSYNYLTSIDFVYLIILVAK